MPMHARGTCPLARDGDWNYRQGLQVDQRQAAVFLEQLFQQAAHAFGRSKAPLLVDDAQIQPAQFLAQCRQLCAIRRVGIDLAPREQPLQLRLQRSHLLLLLGHACAQSFLLRAQRFDEGGVGNEHECKRKNKKDQHTFPHAQCIDALAVTADELVHGVPATAPGGASAICSGALSENSIKACRSVARDFSSTPFSAGTAFAVSFISVILRPRMIGSLLSARRKAGIRSARSALPCTFSSLPASPIVIAVSQTPDTVPRPNAAKNSENPAVLPSSPVLSACKLVCRAFTSLSSRATSASRSLLRVGTGPLASFATCSRCSSSCSSTCVASRSAECA